MENESSQDLDIRVLLEIEKDSNSNTALKLRQLTGSLSREIGSVISLD